MIVAYDYLCRIVRALFWAAAAGVMVAVAIVLAHIIVMAVTFAAAYLYGVLA